MAEDFLRWHVLHPAANIQETNMKPKTKKVARTHALKPGLVGVQHGPSARAHVGQQQRPPQSVQRAQHLVGRARLQQLKLLLLQSADHHFCAGAEHPVILHAQRARLLVYQAPAQEMTLSFRTPFPIRFYPLQAGEHAHGSQSDTVAGSKFPDELPLVWETAYLHQLGDT